MIKKGVFKLSAAVGAENEATATLTATLPGVVTVRAITLSYSGLPEGTVVTVKEGSTGETVLKKSASNTKATYHPVVPAAKAAEAGASSLEVSPVVETLEIALSKGNAGGVLTAWVYYETL